MVPLAMFDKIARSIVLSSLNANDRAISGELEGTNYDRLSEIKRHYDPGNININQERPCPPTEPRPLTARRDLTLHVRPHLQLT
jgi:Berberine and berberine like